MSEQADERAGGLSPISRRAFFQDMGVRALKLGMLGAAAGSIGADAECSLERNCGYCDGAGRDYDHCDGDYCDYINYSDESCGYCDASGQDYDHCDGDYCDYTNYSDESCGYCDAEGQDYDHCDGDYCDYTNYGDVA